MEQRVRAGDEERDRTVEALRGHHEAGRLTAEEFAERMEAALGARYRDELPPLLADLPGEEKEEEQIPERRRAGCAARGPRLVPLLPLLPLIALIALLVVVGSLGVLASGHFPWPLLWAGLLIWWFRGRRVRAAGR